jgi:hypothetical protein
MCLARGSVEKDCRRFVAAVFCRSVLMATLPRALAPRLLVSVPFVSSQPSARHHATPWRLRTTFSCPLPMSWLSQPAQVGMGNQRPIWLPA